MSSEELEAARQRAVPTIDRHKTFYLAGPMSGYEDYNYPAFEAATVALRNSGLLIQSPHEVKWPENHTEMSPDYLWTEMMRLTGELLGKCAGIILLKGWPASRGAREELAYALNAKWPVYFYHDFQLIDMNKEGVN